MTFASVPSGAATFLDANPLIYHFTNDVKYGAACTQLIKRVEPGGLTGRPFSPDADCRCPMSRVVRPTWAFASIRGR